MGKSSTWADVSAPYQLMISTPSDMAVGTCSVFSPALATAMALLSRRVCRTKNNTSFM